MITYILSNHISSNTLRKTNVTSPLKIVVGSRSFPFQKSCFQHLCLLVLGRVSIVSHVSKMWCCSRFFSTMGVSKNSGTPKCMVYNGKPFKMDNLGYHHLRKHPYPWFGSHVPGQCLSNPPNLGPPSHSKPRQFVRQLLMLRALLGWSKFHRLGMKTPHVWWISS